MFLFKIIAGFLLLFATVCSSIHCINKYSKKANINVNAEHLLDDPKIQIRDTDTPFRLAKLNLLWSKATLRLSEPKLKSFYSDLKLYDEEELAFKHLIASGGDDRDGLKEAELRKKLLGIMAVYDLLEHLDDTSDVQKMKLRKATVIDSYADKNIFKDKKLDKLWVKANMAGFNGIELQVLKEEFSHHQEKIDQYYALLKDTDDEDQNSVDENLDRFNTIDHLEENYHGKRPVKYESRANSIRNKIHEIKDGFDRLERLALHGPNHREFIEPKVQNLWMQAVNGNFTRYELESLRTELHHYEKRLLKLRNLHLEIAASKYSEDKKMAGEKNDNLADLESMIEKHSRKIEKLHSNIESRILSKNEL